MSAGPDDKDIIDVPPEDVHVQETPHRRASDHERRSTRPEVGTPRYLDPGDNVFSLWGRVVMARYRRVLSLIHISEPTRPY